MKKLLFIPLLFICISCYASPVITLSGQVINNQSISISGNSFGIKTTVSPMIWDDFESGTNGQHLPDSPGSKWTAYKYNGGYYDSSDVYHGNLCAYNYEGPNGAGEDFDTSYQEFTASDEVYMTYWFKISYTLYSGLTYGTFKLSRITSNYAGGGPGEPVYVPHYSGPGTIALGINMISSPPFFGSYDPWYNNGTSSPTNFTGWSLRFLTVHQKWFRVEMYQKLSTPGVSDGIVYMRAIGYSTGNNNAALTRDTGFGFKLNSVLLGLMPANTEYRGVAKCEMRIDDCYVDNTRARVEIGDNPNFNYCTHREIQIPSAWSDTSITVTINQGSFQNGEQAYLFVVDSDGNASEGYPIVFGGTSLNITGTLQATGSITYE